MTQLAQNTFRLDWPNAKALISGFPKNEKIIHQIMYCFTRVPQFPALISYNRSQTRFELSQIGLNLNTPVNLPPLKYIADLIDTYTVDNHKELWEIICNNGLFDIWEPIAPFTRFQESRSGAYYIGILRIFEIEETFVLGKDVIESSNLRNPPSIISNKRNVTILHPVISDEEFYSSVQLLENSIKQYTTGKMNWKTQRVFWNENNHQANDVQKKNKYENKTANEEILQDDFQKKKVESSLKDAYIERIEIENYFSIDKLVIENLGDKREIYIVGENAAGKTILLQAIIAGLRQAFTDGNVVKWLQTNDNYINNENEESELDTFARPRLFVSIGYDNNESYNFSFPNPKEDEPRIKTNAFAYGVSRIPGGTYKDNKGYWTLFGDYQLIDPVFWLIGISADYYAPKNENSKKMSFSVKDAIKYLEDLINFVDNNDDIQTIRIEVSGKNVKFYEKDIKLEFSELSDGYQTILSLLSDLLNRLIEDQPEVTNIKDFTGVVLVDEIDLLLHPRFAKNVVKKLRTVFPKIQWILTTHSPIVTLGASKDAVLYKLFKNKNTEKPYTFTEITKPYENLSLTANSLITSPLWLIDDFTTESIKDYDISDANYIIQKIYQVMRERPKNEPYIDESEFLEEINKMLENWENEDVEEDAK